jgi:hypothetical protein
LSVDRKACQLRTTFRWLGGECGVLAGLHLSVVSQFGSHQTCSIAGFVAVRIVLCHEVEICVPAGVILPARIERVLALADADHGFESCRLQGCADRDGFDVEDVHRRLSAELEILLERENNKDCCGAQHRPAFLC